jgi:hypothetical protein
MHQLLCGSSCLASFRGEAMRVDVWIGAGVEAQLVFAYPVAAILNRKLLHLPLAAPAPTTPPMH